MVSYTAWKQVRNMTNNNILNNDKVNSFLLLHGWLYVKWKLYNSCKDTMQSNWIMWKCSFYMRGSWHPRTLVSRTHFGNCRAAHMWAALISSHASITHTHWVQTKLRGLETLYLPSRVMTVEGLAQRICWSYLNCFCLQQASSNYRSQVYDLLYLFISFLPL